MDFSSGDFLEGLFASTLSGGDEINPLDIESQDQNLDVVSSLIIKPDELDLSDIPDYDNDSKHFSFRPTNLDEFIGQKKAKELIKLGIKRHKIFDEPIHIFISGTKGHGKTTMAKIISNMLGANFIYRTGAQLENMQNLANVFKEIYQLEKYSVLFIDEIHTLSFHIIEKYFYSAMEDFVIGNKSIKPFTLIAATTEEELLVRKLPPFMDRFNLIVNLEKYTTKNIFKILHQYQERFMASINEKKKIYANIIDQAIELTKNDDNYKHKMNEFKYNLISPYKMLGSKKWRTTEIVRLIVEIGKEYNKELFYFTDVELKELSLTEKGEKLKGLVVKELVEDYQEEHNIKKLDGENLDLIGKNCRLTPRTAINILKTSLVSSVKVVLRANRIIKDSLTDIDFRLLSHLKESERPVGEESLALSVGLTRSKYKTIFEPFLVSQGYVRRTLGGRIITEKGKEILNELETP